MNEHRARYPEQYTHPAIGRVGTLKTDAAISGEITRVVSTQFGQLCEIKGHSASTADRPMTFWALTDLTLEDIH